MSNSEDAKAPAPAPAGRGKGRRRLLMIAVPLIVVVGGGYMWLTGGRYMETDNAYVHQPLIPVSADVEGRIAEVDVAENQQVRKGDVLFRLDDSSYQIALNQAQAALDAARLNVGSLRAAYATAQAQLVAAQAILDVQKRELKRQESLTAKGVASPSALDSAQISAREAQNNVTIAQRGVDSAAAALGGDPDVKTDEVPTVRQAIAARDAAQRDLNKTVVKAPVGGIVSQIDSLNVGQFLSAGTEAASLVARGDTWIEANFKETQLTKVQDGQPAEVTIDAYPGLKLHGTVHSIGAATGAQFALIPAQNATGNWVKVVQRIPVRIEISGTPAKQLRDGMSVGVSVDTGTNRLEDMR